MSTSSKAATRSTASKDAPEEVVSVSVKDLTTMINNAVKKQFDELKKELYELFASRLDAVETRCKDIESDLNIKTEKLMNWNPGWTNWTNSQHLKMLPSLQTWKKLSNRQDWQPWCRTIANNTQEGATSVSEVWKLSQIRTSVKLLHRGSIRHSREGTGSSQWLPMILATPIHYHRRSRITATVNQVMRKHIVLLSWSAFWIVT